MNWIDDWQEVIELTCIECGELFPCPHRHALAVEMKARCTSCERRYWEKRKAEKPVEQPVTRKRRRPLDAKEEMEAEEYPWWRFSRESNQALEDDETDARADRPRDPFGIARIVEEYDVRTAQARFTETGAVTWDAGPKDGGEPVQISMDDVLKREQWGKPPEREVS